MHGPVTRKLVNESHSKYVRFSVNIFDVLNKFDVVKHIELKMVKTCSSYYELFLMTAHLGVSKINKPLVSFM